jgi:septum formation protein
LFYRRLRCRQITTGTPDLLALPAFEPATAAACLSAAVLYLASASPRRSQLLKQLGVCHTVRPVDVDESRNGNEAPADYVRRLATVKAETLWQSLVAEQATLPVLGADTTVVLGHEIFGKPRGRDDGLAMLRRLSGRTHQVLTAVALRSDQGCDLRLSVSDVTFGILSSAQCAEYWQSGEPLDKAGGYAVQGRAAAFIERIAGSYSGIMGLPLYETAQMLTKIGIGLLRGSDTAE